MRFGDSKVYASSITRTHKKSFHSLLQQLTLNQVSHVILLTLSTEKFLSIFNVVFTFSVYLAGSGIDARHIVDGHREKTLALLWQIIFHFQVSRACIFSQKTCNG